MNHPFLTILAIAVLYVLARFAVGLYVFCQAISAIRVRARHES